MMNTITVPVKGLNFAGCAREIEKHLGKVKAIRSVEASYVSQTVTMTYDTAQLSEEHVQAMVRDCGFACGQPLLATRSALRTEHGGSEHDVSPSSRSGASSMH